MLRALIAIFVAFAITFVGTAKPAYAYSGEVIEEATVYYVTSVAATKVFSPAAALAPAWTFVTGGGDIQGATIAAKSIDPPQPSPSQTPETQIAKPVRDPKSGSCECPYDTDKRGRSCGGRSAYSRPGGSDPICYSTD